MCNFYFVKIVLSTSRDKCETCLYFFLSYVRHFGLNLFNVALEHCDWLLLSPLSTRFSPKCHSRDHREGLARFYKCALGNPPALGLHKTRLASALTYFRLECLNEFAPFHVAPVLGLVSAKLTPEFDWPTIRTRDRDHEVHHTEVFHCL